MEQLPSSPHYKHFYKHCLTSLARQQQKGYQKLGVLPPSVEGVIDPAELSPTWVWSPCRTGSYVIPCERT